jgi:hypothetical protein
VLSDHLQSDKKPVERLLRLADFRVVALKPSAGQLLRLTFALQASVLHPYSRLVNTLGVRSSSCLIVAVLLLWRDLCSSVSGRRTLCLQDPSVANGSSSADSLFVASFSVRRPPWSNLLPRC